MFSLSKPSIYFFYKIQSDCEASRYKWFAFINLFVFIVIVVETMHSVLNDLNTNILSAEVNEVEKYINYFFVCAFCSELATTGKSGMVNVISVSHCSKNLNFRNPLLLRMQLLKLRKYSNSAILLPWKFGPIDVQVRMCSIPMEMH